MGTSFRIDFHVGTELSEPERAEVLRQLISGPFAPDEAEISPDGLGWLTYSGLDELEQREISNWMADQRFVAGKSAC